MKKILHLFFVLFAGITGSHSVLAQSDTPCNAPLLSVNEDSCFFISGSSFGATYQNDTANGGIPSCASPGAPDVWYAFIVPPSGAVSITTLPGSVTDGGMSVYYGPCTNPQFVECDDDDANGMMPVIDRTDLVPGDTMLIRFWKGWSPGTGTFELCIIQTHSDCHVASPVCNEFYFPSNAYGKGIYTDALGQALQCGMPEFQSHWLKFKIQNPGMLEFKIFPDSIGPGIYPDYDWILYQSNDSLFCSNFNPQSVAPVACNGSSSSGPMGSTGLDITGVSNQAQPGVGNPFDSLMYVSGGDVYYLFLNNFSTTSSGFSLSFMGSTATFDCNIGAGITSDVPYKNTRFQVYPNPFTDETWLVIPPGLTLNDLTIEICTAMGTTVRLLDKLTAYNVSIRRESLTPGIYLAQIKNRNSLLQVIRLVVI